MKQQLSTILKGLWITALSVFLIFPAMAQKGRDREQSYLTQDMIGRINELVKPLKDQFEKQLRGNETYKAYLGDLQRVSAAKSMEEKNSLTQQINKKYSGFFKEAWSAANVDEKSYQLRIRQIFPPNLVDLISFDAYLNFTLYVPATTIAPTTEPPPPDKCVDVCSIATGEITGTGALIAAGGGAYGNCYLRTNAWSAGFGGSSLFGYLRNGITIPGTFPNDARKLHVTKTFELRQEATSFAALGGGYAETWARTYKTSAYMLVYSPVIFGSSALHFVTIHEDYILQKKDVALSIFRTYAQTFSAFVSGNWCYSSCSSIRWNICEEK